MRKILFNDQYGLTDAVLQGRKTMTRRMVGNRMTEDDIKAYLKGYTGLANIVSPYKIGEVVAVAQAYKDIDKNFLQEQGWANEEPLSYRVNEAGWNNKMFTAAYYLPHQIRITDIKVERLQDCSDDDILKEGIYKDENGRTIGYPFGIPFYYTFYGAVNKDKKQLHWTFPKEAFASLIDAVSGKGTWKLNPFVFAYTFERVK